MSGPVRRVAWGLPDDDGPDERTVAGTCPTCQTDLTTGDPHADWCPEED